MCFRYKCFLSSFCYCLVHCLFVCWFAFVLFFFASFVPLICAVAIGIQLAEF